MSNHFSADKLKFPGDDRRLDLTDLFVFQAPVSPEHHLLHRHHPGTRVRRPRGASRNKRWPPPNRARRIGAEIT